MKEQLQTLMVFKKIEFHGIYSVLFGFASE